MQRAKLIHRGLARAKDEDGPRGLGSSKVLSPFLRGKRESKLKTEVEPEKEAAASAIETRKEKESKTEIEENGEGVANDAEKEKEANVEVRSEEGTEKKVEIEKTKLNGHDTANGDKNGSVVDEEHIAPMTKGKGKGKGKGKSSTVKSSTTSEEEEVKTPKESPAKPKVILILPTT